ncbi:MAG: HK97 gp10 family phage protein [Clostridiales bacterium]|jgi:hypothetical protein|nr:HK97 gp10 family phage protein [Clostridiales bacterium]
MKIEGLAELLERLNGEDLNEFAEALVNRLAADALRNVRFLTPIKSGRLRREWTAERAVKLGHTYRAAVKNPVKYAPYVEYGHRFPKRRDGSRKPGWVEGRFMLTRAVRQTEGEAAETARSLINERRNN